MIFKSSHGIRILKRIINIGLGVVLAAYLTAVVLLHIPTVQGYVGVCVSDAIEDKIGAKVSIGRIDLGFLNRIIIDDVRIYDQKKAKLLFASRLSAKINPSSLLGKELSISSIQLFGMDANIYKDTKTAEYNFKFVLDSLKSKDNTKKSSLALKINSLILRNGKLSLRQQEAFLTHTGKLNPKDIELSGISGHIILNKYSADTLSLKVKKLAFDESSGLHLKKLTFAINAGKSSAALSDLMLQLPGTTISAKQCNGTFTTADGKLDTGSIKVNGHIAGLISPRDIAFIVPTLSKVNESINLSADFRATGTRISIPSLTINTTSDGMYISASGDVSNIKKPSAWHAAVRRAHVTTAFARPLIDAFGVKLPASIDLDQISYVDLSGNASGTRNAITAKASIGTNFGDAVVSLSTHGKHISADLRTDQLSLTPFVKSPVIDGIHADLHFDGDPSRLFTVSGNVRNVSLNSSAYHNIKFHADVAGKKVTAAASIDDNGGSVTVNGTFDHSHPQRLLSLTASVRDFSPSKFGLTGKGVPTLATTMTVKADITGTGISDATGSITAKDISISMGDESFSPKNITIDSRFDGGKHILNIDSDICKLSLEGRFALSSIAKSFENILAKHVHTLPGKDLAYRKLNTNDFRIRGTILDMTLVNKFTDTGIVTDKPVYIDGRLCDASDFADISIDVPHIHYKGNAYTGNNIRIRSSIDALMTDINIRKLMDNGKTYTYGLTAKAADNQLAATLRLNDNEDHPIRGSISARASFSKATGGVSVADIMVEPSDISIGDTIWNVHPSKIRYCKDDLTVDNFSIQHNNQFITIDGHATASADDVLRLKLKKINIEYILNLVNFHSVDFSGMATGEATLSALFSKEPQANADITVDEFRFEGGRMGVLQAGVSLDNSLKQIDINAVAHDTDGRSTDIRGYVSPQRSDIKLDITAHDTRLEFVEGFCSSFMRDIDAKANGKVCLYGPLSNINLTGDLIVDGKVGITSLNTTYSIDRGRVKFIPDAIIFDNDTITDRNGNIGIVTGRLGHQHLTRLTYDLDIAAQNLLSYDTHTFGDNTFYGTAFVTGDCKIHGRSGEVSITVNGTPQKGSILVYNVASPDAISSQDFIKWKVLKHDEGTDSLSQAATGSASDDTNFASDMRLSFLINCTPDATIRLIMDNTSGDYITLNGNGVLKANYYNKGAFDLYGNYIVDSGHYKMTIQNMIKRDFLFRNGGTISFGGNPYSAVLNLNAVYTLNSVSLADLNIGKSFRSNNTRVDCIMNINGTPAAPHVDFSLDIPSISSDARQMVYSLMNSEEEMNQQVLYLLAVGRFMNQGRNNAVVDDQNQQSQASLAMQSILSSTIMQQVNDVIGNLTSNSQWNFGANISTGTEGLYNAEYEGLLSGRLLSGRLLVDGQFGYRDKANATTSFIGDFDIQYLLYPNGNLALNFYNKTNDRYFTRNSLTTQGIGLLMRREFTNLSDLFGIKKRRRTAKPADGATGK